MQPLLLSLIADLLRAAPLAHECLSDWLSTETQASAPQLLLRLWREAETDWQVCTDGVVTSTQLPLKGAGRRALWIPKREVRPAPACVPLLCRHQRCSQPWHIEESCSRRAKQGTASRRATAQ